MVSLLLSFPPFLCSRKKGAGGRYAVRWVRCCLLLLNGYSLGLYFGVCRKCPVYFFIGQGAVNASAHYQPAILQNFPPCILLAFGKDFKYALENILRFYSVFLFLLHNPKILPLIICVPLVRHSIACGGWAKNDVYHIHRQRTCRVPFLRLSV